MSSYSGMFEINTNLTSLVLQNQFNKITSDLIKYMERVSTGNRVNRASDDPSGSVLITRYNTQISSLSIAQKNSQTGINFLKTAENDLETIKGHMTDMKELAEQAKDPTLSDEKRTVIATTYENLKNRILDIAENSNYSGIKLLNGSNSTSGSVVLQIDINNDYNSRLDISSALKSARMDDLGLMSTSISDVVIAEDAGEKLEDALKQVSIQLGEIGAFNQSLSSNIDRLKKKSAQIESSRNVILKSDSAQDTAELTKLQLLQQTTASLLQQANSSSALALTLLGRY